MSSMARSPELRTPKALAPTLAILVAMVGVVMLATRFWTEVLWYRTLDSSSVFTTRLANSVVLFLGAAVLMGAGVAANMIVAARLHPMQRATRPAAPGLLGLNPDRRGFVLVPALVLGILAGVSALSELDTFLAWREATPFGVTDPYFSLDVGFYVFQLPWWNFVLGMVMATLVVSTLAAGLVHLVIGSSYAAPIRVMAGGQDGSLRQPQVELRNPFTERAQAHLSVLFGLLLLAYGIDQMLARYDYASSDNGLLTGITYTDDHSRITARLIVAMISLVCALVFFANARIRRWLLPGSALVLMVVSSLILSTLYPGIIQRFNVAPDEPTVEAPYISRHIEATRRAYGINETEITPYSATTTVSAGQLKSDAAALPGIRLMDPAMISPTFEQLQQVRGYYAFPPVLDVDRYTINGEQTDAIVAAREIDLGEIPDASWNNLHTFYTHGYAMVAAYGNRRQPSGEPAWIVGDIPPTGDLAEHEPRIYFGERASDYAVVGAPEGTPPVELDTPGGGSTGGETRNTYQGSGGVPIGGWLNRVLYAIRFADINLLLSNRVNESSQILYDRTPAERVAKVAPWLTVDSDPYPAIVDGRVVWILDGYTISDAYPNSQRVDLRSVTSDSVSQQRGLTTSQPLNYIRNSVKAVVDAYEGTVSLYAWDETDPLLQTWSKVFPGLLKPKSEVGADLMAHLRYPQDLFKAQRQVLGRYHTTDSNTWFQQSDLWQVPNDPRATNTKEPPFYLSIKWPGDAAPVFSQTAVYVPKGRENLGAYLAVVADASSPDYGKLRVLKLSDTQQIAGPGQTFNAITTDQQVAERLRPFVNQGTADALYGNLLTLPLGGGLLYVQPIYTQRKESGTSGSGSYPLLRFVVVRFGDYIGIADTLQEALDQVFQGDSGAETGEQPSGGGTTPPTTPQTGPEAAKAALQVAAAAYQEADRALKAGNLAEYQRQIEIMRVKLLEAEKALR